MLRAFTEHHIRQVGSLDGLWDFAIESDQGGESGTPRSYPRKLYVPSAWETTPGLENYRGKGWLRTAVCGNPGKAMRLVFGGVSHTGTVYVDGERVGQHYDAFTPWDVVVPGLAGGRHELVVEVDNTFGDHSALHKCNDYFTYGGITRPVEVQYVPEVFIDKLFATPHRCGDTWGLDVRVRLRNWSDTPCERRVIVTVAGSAEELGSLTVPPGGDGEMACTIRGLCVNEWSEASPTLYYATATLLDGDTPVDDLSDRVGFRELTVRGREFLLNGAPLRLRGVNRHEDHPQFGCAIPVEAMMQDLALIRDLGCNFVRTCHYPNDTRFLDLCDELGVYVWEESHARSVSFAHPMFRKQIADSTRETVEWHFNRPCIVVWGCLNECDSCSDAGREEHERVLRQFRELDPSRPRTFASNKSQKDICLDLVDIVSWNRYDAWYGGGVSDIEPRLAQQLAWLHSEASGGADKPVIMSEFGGGAIYGNRQRCRSKWSEEYQSDVLDESLRIYCNHPDIVGVAIWQFCDVRITQDHWNNRPRTMNNKGVVDEYRRPKLSYDTVKQRMTEAATTSSTS